MCTTTSTILQTQLIKLGEYVLKFECGEEDFDADDKEKARKELRETPEIVEESIKELRKLLKSKFFENIFQI